MCLYMLPMVKEMVADRDITFYKIGLINDEGVFISRVIGYSYVKDEVQPKIEIIPTEATTKDRCTNIEEYELLGELYPRWRYYPNDYGLKVIRQGYHGYISMDSCDPYLDSAGVFIIPKGTRYLINEEVGVLVAETCIFKNEL